jgi:hypothetical protein
VKFLLNTDHISILYFTSPPGDLSSPPSINPRSESAGHKLATVVYISCPRRNGDGAMPFRVPSVHFFLLEK